MSSGLQGYALSTDTSTVIVSAYAAGQKHIEAKAAAPGWIKVGAFFLQLSVQCRLEVLGFVSAAALTGTIKLYDLTLDDFVTGSDAVITSQSDFRALSGVISLTGSRELLVLAQCIGTPATNSYLAVDTASLVGA